MLYSQKKPSFFYIVMKWSQELIFSIMFNKITLEKRQKHLTRKTTRRKKLGVFNSRDIHKKKENREEI
jgi:hypothetical protein